MDDPNDSEAMEFNYFGISILKDSKIKRYCDHSTFYGF